MSAVVAERLDKFSDTTEILSPILLLSVNFVTFAASFLSFYLPAEIVECHACPGDPIPKTAVRQAER